MVLVNDMRYAKDGPIGERKMNLRLAHLRRKIRATATERGYLVKQPQKKKIRLIDDPLEDELLQQYAEEESQAQKRSRDDDDDEVGRQLSPENADQEPEQSSDRDEPPRRRRRRLSTGPNDEEGGDAQNGAEESELSELSA